MPHPEKVLNGACLRLCLDAFEERDAANWQPLSDQDVSVSEELGTVWVHKLTWKEFRSRTATSWQVCDASTITEVDSNLVVFVQNGYDTREIGDEHMSILNICMARLTHSILVNSDELAIQREVMQAIVAAVTDHHEWLGSTRIDPDAVWLAKLSISATTAAPRSYQVTLDIELMNPV
jgi:hypothetical protein